MDGSWQQPQASDVPGAQHGEVPVVERRQLGLSKPFHQREHARVDDAQRLVAVLGL